jgi:hypothetical protein
MSEQQKSGQWPKIAILNVDQCPRCAKKHAAVEFRSFTLGDRQYTHWAICEATGEPLLVDMRVKSRVPDQFMVRFVGTGQKAQCRPNPAYPDGIDIPAPAGEGDVCRVLLPYPAKEIGAWKIECTVCGLRTACTTAGRPDDPRSITVRCNKSTKP